jgi:hypothetical protein
MTVIQSRIEVLSDVAAAWRDSDHSPRRTAVEATLEAPNRWTEQALDHVLNRWTQRLTPDALEEWVGRASTSEARDATIGVVHASEGPLSSFRLALGALLFGAEVVGAVPESSPALQPTFAEAVAEEGAGLDVSYTTVSAVLERADIVLADPIERGDDSIETVCDEHGIPEDRRHIRPPVYSVGIVDGHESEDEMERLAEDMLLFEGEGRRRLAVVWAPRDHAPDAYLEAMARFRGLFPAHEDTPGSLQMQQAFLEARDESHAYADGLEFLVSRGDPEPQRSAHVRWAEYDALENVHDWWREHRDEVCAVIARRHLHDRWPGEDEPLRTPGGVHVPPLDDKEGEALVSFLTGLLVSSDAA